MLGFGITFVYNIAQASEDIKSMSLSDLDNRMVELRCGYTEKVCVDRDRLDIRADELKVVTMRLLNIGTSETDFRITVRPGIYVDPTNVKTDPSDPAYQNNFEVLPLERIEKIAPNDAKSFAIGFQRPKGGVDKGTYVFDVIIEHRGASGSFVEYEPVHKMYVSAS